MRDWPAAAVHDTVAAVLRTAPYRQSVQNTLLQRIFSWLGQGLRWLTRELGGVPGGRNIVIWLLALLALLIAARVLLSARAREAETPDGWLRGRTRAGEDPWQAAERLAAAGDHEGAAHALYRGVLASLAQRERLRLDPSRTSGDYARELRARGSAAHQPFRAFARRFDAAVYGHGRLDAALLQELVQLAVPLRSTARAA